MEDVLLFPVNVYMLKNLELRPQAFSCRGPVVMLGYAIKASQGPVKAPGQCMIHSGSFMQHRNIQQRKLQPLFTDMRL